ncbi:M1 family aminopeptidase [Clostridium oryzae]|uniref:CAAX amino terminal protease self-immunity n=1 Tax=Clostridium oryzae TaxID=1450648 RepID=A0A1V4IKQ5_9CLOT|nr:M1 family aminopeptidase [Clostridium oryzae]OPJ60483.1 CAAX amino terminal protease self- immunity [Clostridium oryzae]
MKKYVGPFFKGILLLVILLFTTIIISSAYTPSLSALSKILYFVPYFLAALITLFILVKMNKDKFINYGLNFKAFTANNFLRGMLYGFFFSLCLLILLLVTFEANVLGFVKQDQNIFSVAVLGILNIFLYVLGQELLFRGYLLNYFRKKFTLVGAIILASIIYAIAIPFNSAITPLAFFNNVLFGVLLSVIYIKSEKIEYVIGMHFTYRLLFNFLLSTPVEGKVSAGIFNLGFMNVDLLNGGMYGVQGGIIFLVVTVLFSVFICLKNKIHIRLTVKNIVLSCLLICFTAVYIFVDVKAWSSQHVKNDTVPVKSAEKLSNINNYNMIWNLDTDNKRVNATEEVDYINNSSDSLSEIYFHMYAAAFKKYKGDISILSVKVNNEKIKYSVEGIDDTLLKVPLQEKLLPQKRVKISIEYIVYVPKRSYDGFSDRFAYSNKFINLGNIFPIAAVYKDGAWDKHAYDKKGDAFYSETSNFSVKITAPKSYILASTGNIVSEKLRGRNKIWKMQADTVRDFAVVASQSFKVAKANVNGTIVKSYALDINKAQKVLKFSVDAIKSFNNRFGEYPYATCSVVQTDLNGGMEYPNLVMIGSYAYDNINANSIFTWAIYNSPTGELEFTVVHELAHQWWYGLVGNDEYRNAWIDEPLTQFSTLLYYKDVYGKKRFESVYNKSIALNYTIYKAALTTKNFKQPLDKYSDLEYNALIYYRVPMLIKKYYDSVGDEKFNSVLQDTFNKYKFKVLDANNYPIPLKN